MADVAKTYRRRSCGTTRATAAWNRRRPKWSKNQMQHNLAISLLVDQFRLLNAAISEKA